VLYLSASGFINAFSWLNLSPKPIVVPLSKTSLLLAQEETVALMNHNELQGPNKIVHQHGKQQRSKQCQSNQHEQAASFVILEEV
jgi:hypothetical protein